ncbi:MAG TPA: thymidine kinase [bacterium]|nr:thymidine kinase [bacterium]HPS28836.1 thymidine kinase [bacterium]
MAKLYFRYGAMGASKTSNALMVEYNYRERDQNALIMKPSIDTREGVDIVKSRIGLGKKAILVFPASNVFEIINEQNIIKKIDCVIIDEAQFLSKDQVDQLCDVVDILSIPVIAYGLRADFRGELFEGSLRLLAMADTIEEIKTVCWCSRKAIMNARVINGSVIKEGEQILIGGNESYIALCRKHWAEGNLGNRGKK